jgi:MoaA/NifB/PqqE/SkfB family radical SAM enzyme
MIIISFPGDEKESGGCLAAGRGFFHINATGGAEPCPFSPYSDTSLRTTSLKAVLNSPLFTRLREEGALDAEHTGGCALFAQAEYVERIASGGEALSCRYRD